jgi:hypothetical protein
MAEGRWLFRKGKNDHESSGSRHWLPLEDDDGTPLCTVARAPRDRVYVPIRMARSLYTRNRSVPWPDANLPARWLLNSRRVSVLLIPREGPERVPEIMRQRVLLPPHLRRDPAFAITSLAWDTFGSWEWRADRRTGFLGNSDWDQRWALKAPIDDGGGHDGDVDDGNDDNGRQPPPPPPNCDEGTGKTVRDDTDDFVGNVVYNVLLANERGEHYELAPELTEDKQL